MSRQRTFVASLAAACLIAAAAPGLAWSPEELWEVWERSRFVTPPPPCVSPGETGAYLEVLAREHAEVAAGGGVRLEVVGESFEGRPIRLLTLGRGDRKVLLWSQMHGDEPSATPALIDLADFLLDRAAEPDPDPAAVALLDELTLLIVPMLNPDGASRYLRHNAQGIDVNRDALNLATPEGRLLAELRDEHEPILGFNLHDQGRRITVGDSGVLATVSVLAVAGDAAGTMTPGRERARRAAAAVAAAVEPFFPGGVGRYDEDFNPRAFGDNLTAWGTPVLLIESGGLPPGRLNRDLARLNFVAILRVLEDLARDDLAGHDPAVYERLGRNRRNHYADVVVRGGSILRPAGRPYRADLGFDFRYDDQQWADCEAVRGPDRSVSPVPRTRVEEIGDFRLRGAGRSVDARGRWLVAPFTVGVEAWPAPDWLSGDRLPALSALGVGRVVWRVPPDRLAEARRNPPPRRHCPRCPVLEVSSAERRPPAVTLERPPGAAESNRLDHVLAALFGDRWEAGERPSDLELLRALWDAGGDRVLWPGAPASFLVLAPEGAPPFGGTELGGGGESAEGAELEEGIGLDAAALRLEQVWVDGFEAGGVER